MHWRWLIGDFVDPEFKKLTRQQKRELWHRMRHLSGARRFDLFLAVAPAAIMLAALLLISSINIPTTPTGQPQWWPWLSTLVLVAICAYFATGIAIAAIVRRWLDQAMRSRPDPCPHCGCSLGGLARLAMDCPECGVSLLTPHCPRCSYSLRGLGDRPDRCPECGTPLKSAQCLECGYNFRGLREDSRFCPECGTDRGYLVRIEDIVAAPGPLTSCRLLPDCIDRSFEFDPDLRTSLLKVAARGFLRDAQGVWLYGAGLTALIGMYMMLAAAVWPAVVAGSALTLLIAIFNFLMIGLPLLWLANWYLWKWTFAPHVWSALRDHGSDICLQCGRWLRGSTEQTSHCPTCGTAMIATQRRPLDLIARAAKFVMPPLVDRRLRRDRALWRAMHAEAMLRLHNRRDVLIYIVAMTAVAAVSGLALASLYSLPQFSAAMQWSTFASCALLGVAVHVAIHRWRLRPYLREAFRARGI